ncbi:hypothetical protein ACFL4H_00270 [Candidatus Neomarinimicrobiota bacterium]
MAKVNQSDIDKMKKAGISLGALQILEEKDLISKRRITKKKYMFLEDGTSVVPELCFKGLGKKEKTPEMLELKSQVNQLFDKFTKELKDEGSNEQSIKDNVSNTD